MNTQLPPEENQLPDQHIPGSMPGVSQPPDAEEPLFLFEDDVSDAASSFETQHGAPFQHSRALPPVNGSLNHAPSGVGASPISSLKPRRKLKFPLLLTVSLGALAVIVLLSVVVTVFAVQTTPRAARNGAPVIHATASSIQHSKGKGLPTPKASSTPFPGTGQPGQTSSWVPQQLPNGWRNAGLTPGDALFAERTGWAFTDREEALDFRNVGTQAQHGGTFTAAAFLLSAGGKTRFEQNDVRVANNVLFKKVVATQRIQSAVNAVPSLVKFQVQGQQQFAWIDVAYQRYQSQLNSTTQQRTEGIEMNPMTNQPRIHHMSVLLVRIPPGTQGQNAPMGGSGWLVSNYGLDMPNGALVDILQPI